MMWAQAECARWGAAGGHPLLLGAGLAATVLAGASVFVIFRGGVLRAGGWGGLKVGGGGV